MEGNALGIKDPMYTRMKGPKKEIQTGRWMDRGRVVWKEGVNEEASMDSQMNGWRDPFCS